MEPITGLLADFRREINRLFDERYTDEQRIELERDEGVRRSLELRTLHLDSDEDEDMEGDGT
jgi:hypothetical protein